MDVNLLPANNIYLFGLVLLDLYFTKELSQSLIFTSTKSKKPMLDQEKVGTIIGKWLHKDIMNNIFPDEQFDAKKFHEKANQKCRDVNNTCCLMSCNCVIKAYHNKHGLSWIRIMLVHGYLSPGVLQA